MNGEGRVEIRREDAAVLCEGNFDLVALHQAGFRNALAPMGTAFTEEQAKHFLCAAHAAAASDVTMQREVHGMLIKQGMRCR